MLKFVQRAGENRYFDMPDDMPEALYRLLVRRGIDSSKQCCQITRQERETLCAMVQALPITLSRLAPLDEAIVTRGGVTVKEINPATMESKLLPGLFFAGEVMDVDAHTGGYNLQVAWSTGALAGQSAAEQV